MSQRIVCYGELLLRLGPPGRQLFLQSPTLDVHVGGAEANVAVSLARFGHDVAMVSIVADNPLGQAAIGELRRHGVDARWIERAPGRMGLYFLSTGSILRPSEVIYDRAGSTFATAAADRIDWSPILAGASLLHLSGVTPALGADAAAGCLRAAKAASAAGIDVVFDGNFRAKLWDVWKGDAASITRQLMAEATLLFADHRDIGIALGWQAPQGDAESRIAAAAEAAFRAFPKLQRMASTIREQRNVDHHALSAVIVNRSGTVARTPVYELTPIVDRIGGGDAFAAGVLHGLASGMDDAQAVHFGVGAASLKHSVPGDFNLVGVDDVAALIGDGRLDVKR